MSAMTTTLALDWREFFAQYRDGFADVRATTTRRRSIPGLTPNMFTSEVMDVFVFPWGMIEVSTGLIPVLGERPRRERRGVGLSVRLGTPDWHRECDEWSRLVCGDDITITDVRRAFDAIVTNFS